MKDKNTILAAINACDEILAKYKNINNYVTLLRQQRSVLILAFYRQMKIESLADNYNNAANKPGMPRHVKRITAVKRDTINWVLGIIDELPMRTQTRRAR